MKLSSAETSDNLPIQRLVSENSVWEMGIYPVLFGFRVRVGQVGKAWYTFDYCAADNVFACVPTLSEAG